MFEEFTSGESQEISESGLFEGDYYLAVNPDVAKAGLDPFSHFCNFGSHEGRSPNLYFDADWYMQQYPDVISAAMNPLLHYVRHGDHEGRQPTPIFDTQWYRAAYAVEFKQLALAHFLGRRHGGHVLPSPTFYAARYVEPCVTISAKGGDPYADFVTLAAGISRNWIEQEVIRNSGLFDPNYYLINGSDLLDVDVDPVSHFQMFGWRERRKPNIYFDPSWYLDTNPEVARLGINPLTHYILEGEAVGRRPVVYFDPLWYRVTYGVPPAETALAHYLARRRDQVTSPNPFFNAAWYAKVHRTEVGLRRDPFAHYLQAGVHRDIQPSADFDARGYRRSHLGRPSRSFRHLMRPERHNPLVHYILRHYTNPPRE